MSVNGRLQLLERYGRLYGELHLAVAWTATNDPERGDPKKVVTEGWDKTKPLADGGFGAGLFPIRGKTKNPALVLRPSNLIGLECDTEEDLERIESLGLPKTITVVSSQPFKRHFWFRPPAALEVVPFVAFRFESGKLSKDSGRYLILPPALHPTGAVYSFLPDHAPDEGEIAEMPEDIYRRLCEQARQEDAELRERIQVDSETKIRAGKRRDYLYRYGCMLRRWGLGREELAAAVHAYNDARCEPPVERHLVEVQVDGAMKHTGGEELAAAALLSPETDEANASADEPLPFLTLAELCAEVDAAGPRRWLVRGIWPAGAYGVHAAEMKAQKTWNALDLAVAVASHTPWLGSMPIDDPGPVVVFAGEGGKAAIVRRLRAICAARGLRAEDLPIVVCPRAPHLSNAVHLAFMAEKLDAVRPRLVFSTRSISLPAALTAKTSTRWGKSSSRLNTCASGLTPPSSS